MPPNKRRGAASRPAAAAAAAAAPAAAPRGPRPSDAAHPLVSILTPTYNRRRFIAALIECVKAQTYPRDRILEWVVFDDGTDRVSDLFEAAGLPFVRYIGAPAGGARLTVGAKRNRLNAEARGEVCVCFDDDDYYPPERVAHAVHKLNGSKVRDPASGAPVRPDVAGSSVMHLNFTDTGQVATVGPFGAFHATNGTLAYRTAYARAHAYDEAVTHAEEASFLDRFRVPLVQLDPLKTIVVTCHDSNTYDKRPMRDGGNPYLHMTALKLRQLIPNAALRAVYEAPAPAPAPVAAAPSWLPPTDLSALAITGAAGESAPAKAAAATAAAAAAEPAPAAAPVPPAARFKAMTLEQMAAASALPPPALPGLPTCMAELGAVYDEMHARNGALLLAGGGTHAGALLGAPPGGGAAAAAAGRTVLAVTAAATWQPTVALPELVAELRAVFDAHGATACWFAPDESSTAPAPASAADGRLHLTLLQAVPFAAAADVAPGSAKEAAVAAALADGARYFGTSPSAEPLLLRFAGVVWTPTGLALRGFPAADADVVALLKARRGVADHAALVGALDAAALAFAPRADTLHATLLRFTSPPSGALVAALAALLERRGCVNGGVQPLLCSALVHGWEVARTTWRTRAAEHTVLRAVPLHLPLAGAAAQQQLQQQQQQPAAPRRVALLLAGDVAGAAAAYAGVYAALLKRVEQAGGVVDAFVALPPEALPRESRQFARFASLFRARAWRLAPKAVCAAAAHEMAAAAPPGFYDLCVLMRPGTLLSAAAALPLVLPSDPVAHAKCVWLGDGGDAVVAVGSVAAVGAAARAFDASADVQEVEARAAGDGLAPRRFPLPSAQLAADAANSALDAALA
jgi:hypothetical protein